MCLKHGWSPPNGFSISLMSEWIENPADQVYDKQDCERKAFTRLATHLKQAFPRLPILILADGLYRMKVFLPPVKRIIGVISSLSKKVISHQSGKK